MAEEPKIPPAVQEVVGPAEAPDLGGPGGENEHIPTDKNRATVKGMVACGRPQEEIAAAIKISPMTLRKHYREDLDLGAAEVNQMVLGKLFKKINDDDTASILFYCKTRLGMKETVIIDGTLRRGVDASDVPDPRVLQLGEKMKTDGL